VIIWMMDLDKEEGIPTE